MLHFIGKENILLSISSSILQKQRFTWHSWSYTL